MNWKLGMGAGFIICLWAACANIQGISGGPDDLSPPKWILEGSSANMQTEFKEREIKFSFDEWFRLENPNSQIQIAPTTEFPLIYKLSGKTLIVKFDDREVLKPNTTYILQLGTSVKDITKGNVAENVQYVFSTGLFIDSLRIRGSVIDAFTGDVQKQTLVCLYLESEDSVFRKRKPYYFSLTDAGGQFELKHLSPGTYTLYALGDKNNNFYFDQPTETIAFLDQKIQLTPQQTPEPLVLKTSLQKFLLNAKEKNLKPGYTSLILNRKPSGKVLLSTLSDSVKFVHQHDSIKAWNFSMSPQEFTLQVENYNDTLLIKPLPLVHSDSSFTLRLTNVSISPDDTLKLISEFPLCEMATKTMQSNDSSVLIKDIRFDDRDPRVILVAGKWPQGKQFSLYVSGGQFKNCFKQLSAQDTLRVLIPPLNSFATLNLEIDSIKVPMNVIMQLLRNNILIKEKATVLAPIHQQIIFKNLPPGTYRLRVIHDLDENEQWDGSDLQNKKQAEPVYYFNLPELRADWEVKAKIKL